MTGGEISLALAAGIFTGVVSSMLGVGGGLIVIPFMLLVFHAPQHVAEGTSLVVIIPTAIAGAAMHARNGLVESSLLRDLILGGVLGVIAGGLVALQTDGGVLRAIYTGFVFFISYRFLRPRKAEHR